MNITPTDGSILLALRGLVPRLATLVDEQRKNFLAADGLGHGLFIGEADVDAALEVLHQLPPEGVPDHVLARLGAIFLLEDEDLEVLVAAAATAIDRRFGVIYGYLNDNLSKRVLTVELALRIQGSASWDGAARHALGRQGVLARSGLLEVTDDDDPLHTELRVPGRVVEHLLGIDVAPREVAAAVEPLVPGAGTPPDVAAALASGAPFVYFRSAHEGSVSAAVASAADSADVNVVHLDLRNPLAAGTFPGWLDLALREVALQGAVPLLGPVPEGLAAGSFDGLSQARTPVLLYGTHEWDVALSNVSAVTIDVPTLSEGEQGAIWSAAFAALDVELDAGAVAAYRLPGPAVVRSVRRAVVAARIEDREVDADLVAEQVRREYAPAMERLSQRIIPTVTTDALVLPPPAARAVANVVARIRNRDRVRDELGVRSQGSKGRGFTALFAGRSGTGKTLAAEGICGELGVDLYVVNLSSVLSKYIGETEKNLEAIFTAANDVSGVLFFDEADALFGKRSEVSDSKDRYANIEVAYLLQRLEHFDGVAILASNLRANLDDAFSRRLDAVVNFPEPAAAERLQLWELHLPPTLPRAGDLDLGFAAERFTISGGSIASAAQTAAHEVARTGEPLDSAMLARAVAAEFDKVGRLVSPGDFGDWLDHLDRD